ncbi:uncharacterized protein LY89DRAFT_727267 [Mollisia scopiformis]|uniref:Uncharacterized protein n=1 Tax=Mollisia scopiformis TaxID=149040 RepID=A0A194XW42_MOLSC|nr:uncharacterized protein LY89DRAFT_727267 [Mollisia scopiformis]KUJ24234.1 hypothetical protein LY89DRAFT_727267 [Mollisia scopiformis]
MSSASASPVRVSEDDWHSVKDAKKRKQIQDKLAQRARRKRLRETKKIKQQTVQFPESQMGHHGTEGQTASDATVQLAPSSLDPTLCSSFGDVILSSSSLTPSFDSSSFLQPPNLNYELPYQLTLAGALFINGQILGLSCSVSIPARSSPASPDCPPALRPTATQLLTVHSHGVDRFPFPKMRDNAINLACLIDEEELTRDLFLMPSFSLAAGCTPWDPRAWKVERPFADKWAFLFQ